MEPPTKDQFEIEVEFTGGLDMLFNGLENRRKKLPIPKEDTNGVKPNIDYLVKQLCENHMRDPRKELFVLEDGKVRPGILVLINDCDWELEGKHEYELGPKDEIIFMSTLHGG